MVKETQVCVIMHNLTHGLVENIQSCKDYMCFKSQYCFFIGYCSPGTVAKTL